MIEQTIKIIRAQDLTIKFLMDRPRDITGWTMQWDVFDKLGGTQRITKTTSSGITISNAKRGEISITLAKANTSSLTLTSALSDGFGYIWELRRTDSGSEVTLARGELILLQEVFTG